MNAAPRRSLGAGALVFGGGLLAGLALAWLVESRRASEPIAAPRVERTGGAPRVLGLEALRLSDTAGVVANLAHRGVPQVVMINSTNCGVCKRALADLRDAAAGAPVPHLTVVTIEGADSGAVMMRAARLVPGGLLGPANEGVRTTLAFQFPGTPVFIALDSGARVVASMPGYPGGAAFTSWRAVMFGTRTRPE